MRGDKKHKQKRVAAQIDAVRHSQWKFNLVKGVVGRASVPLMVEAAGGHSYDLIASGILMNVVGHVFLFTAGHALEALKGRSIFVPAKAGRILEIGGAGRISPNLDAGILHLEVPYLDQFLDVALPAGMIYAPSSILTDPLLVYGYPARKFKRKRKVASCDPGLYLMTARTEAAYKRFQYSPQEHILLDWPKKLFGPYGVVRSPSLTAMSGCGVWLAPQAGPRHPSKPNIPPSPIPRLVGTFIEQRRRDAMLVATNIGIHLRMVWKGHPDLLELHIKAGKVTAADDLHRDTDAPSSGPAPRL